MSVKISAARRQAFVRALAATGNWTIAAERARMSRSSVQRQRRADAGFDAECRRALREAQARLGRGGQARPPSGWGFLDGAELVVQGRAGSRGGRRIQIARARLGQWTPRIEARFLATLAATCNANAACRAAGMSKSGAYAHRRRWPAFERKWMEAMEEGYARIEIALIENGCNLFSDPEVPPAAPMPDMSADQAIQMLSLHRFQVRGIGKPPGVRRYPPRFEDVRASIERKVAAILRARGLRPGVRAQDREEYGRRRHGRSGSEAEDAIDSPSGT